MARFLPMNSLINHFKPLIVCPCSAFTEFDLNMKALPLCSQHTQKKEIVKFSKLNLPFCAAVFSSNTQVQCLYVHSSTVK